MAEVEDKLTFKIFQIQLAVLEEVPIKGELRVELV